MFNLLDIPSPTKKRQENGGDSFTLNFFNALTSAPNKIAGHVNEEMKAGINEWAGSYKRLQNEGAIAQYYVDLANKQLGHTLPGQYQGNINSQQQLVDNPTEANTAQDQSGILKTIASFVGGK